MRVFVTGGTGNIGPAVVARLVEDGHDVTVAGRRECADVPVGSRYAACDVRDYDGLLAAVRGHEAIVHLAARGAPVGFPGRIVYGDNTIGTWNVFEAAAEAGVGRVVAASSINALGYFFGDRSFPVRYLPIDEHHPCLATDAYSFSKQNVERIAAYFWERDRISSALLRIPAVMRHDAVLEGRHHFLDYDPSVVRRLLELDDAARRVEILRLQSAYDSYRRAHRADATDPGLWGNYDRLPAEGMTRDAYTFMLHTVHFYTYLDDLDCADAFSRAASADYDGSHVLFVNSSRNSLGLPVGDCASFYEPRPEVRPAAATDDTLISIDAARRLLGFEPRWSLRTLLG